MRHPDRPPTTPADRPTDIWPQEAIRLRDSGDVVVTLPFHLGYHPEDSLVLISLRGGRVDFLGRADLPGHGVDPWETVDALLHPVMRDAPDAVVLVGYEQVAGAAEPASRLARDVLTAHDIAVVDRIVVRDGRYWSPDCPTGCCPDDGTRMPRLEDVPAVADFVLLGRAPLPSRRSLDTLLDPAPEAQLPDVRTRSLGRAYAKGAQRGGPGRTRRRTAALSAWASMLAEPAPVPDSDGFDVPLLVASLRDIDLRDLLISVMCPGSLALERFDAELVALARAALSSTPWWPEAPGSTGVETESRYAALLHSLILLARLAPGSMSAPPLSVLANIAWWRGDGALTRSALDRALEVEPDYRLAVLLERMLDLGVRPERAA